MSQPGRSSSGRGKANRFGSPSCGLGLDRRPARLRQAQKLGRLVERLARRVVDGAAKPRKAVRALARSGTGNARPTPAASDRETPAHPSAAASAHGPQGGSPPPAAAPSPPRCPRASITPDSTPPISPGPAVTAIASSSASVTPAAASASSTTPSSRSAWARAAISGTTPPKAACSAVWPSTSDDRISGARPGACARRPPRYRRSCFRCQERSGSGPWPPLREGFTGR